mmetsp:Transcript_61557/g.132798  ORF Transcript_61557/g.132798 Transcript_61557/m.132798 type:complete len:324 (+) Transcript_61557:59-1030(+)
MGDESVAQPKRGRPTPLAVNRTAVSKIRKLEGSSIDQHYTLTIKEESAGIYSALQVQTGKEFLARVVQKDKFELDPACGTKYSEADWRSVCDSVFSTHACQKLLQIHDMLEDDQAFYIVMEKCSGADYLQSVLYEKELTEVEIKRIIRQLLTALDQLHEQGFVHRDVSPKTLRFRGTNFSLEKQELVLLPSEANTRFEATSPAHRPSGGTDVDAFNAPERYSGEYSPLSDLWSVGVVLYILITGQPPSISTDGVTGSRKQVIEAFKKSPIDFDSDPWPEFPQARDFCQKLLAIDPMDRTPSSAEALMHEWLAGDDQDEEADAA